MQTSVAIADGKVTGTLKYIEGGLAESGPLAGSGYFLALKWSAPEEGVTSLKVGLTPTMGTGLVECIDDNDHNGVFKITNKDKQFVTIVQANATYEHWQNFALDGLTLEAAE